MQEARDYNIVQLLNEYGYEVERGNMLKCPFHHDKTPSARYYKDSNSIYCFSCAKKWNPIDFVMDHDQVSYAKAVYRLTNKFVNPEQKIIPSWNLDQIIRYFQIEEPILMKMLLEYGNEWPDYVLSKNDYKLKEMQDILRNRKR